MFRSAHVARTEPITNHSPFFSNTARTPQCKHCLGNFARDRPHIKLAAKIRASPEWDHHVIGLLTLIPLMVSGFRYLISGIRHQVSGISYQESGVRCRCQMTGFRCQVPRVMSQVSDFRCQLSGVRCQVSAVRCQVSAVSCQVWGVRYQVSGEVLGIRYQLSAIRATKKRKTFKIFLLKNHISAVVAQIELRKRPIALIWAD